mgnify:CR=1 FL=1
MEKESEIRRKKLAQILYTQLSKVVKRDEKVRRMLSSQEIENGLQILINRIVDDVLEKEAKLKRKLTIEELKECIMKVLDEFSPETGYII